MFYVTAVLCLAVVGANNRFLGRTQQALVDQKEAMRIELAELRMRAESVRGPEAVRAFAVARGMVPTSTMTEERQITPFPAPVVTRDAATGLSLSTQWRSLARGAFD